MDYAMKSNEQVRLITEQFRNNQINAREALERLSDLMDDYPAVEVFLRLLVDTHRKVLDSMKMGSSSRTPSIFSNTQR